ARRERDHLRERHDGDREDRRRKERFEQREARLRASRYGGQAVSVEGAPHAAITESNRRSTASPAENIRKTGLRCTDRARSCRKDRQPRTRGKTTDLAETSWSAARGL